jgi:outer membrane protein OmpA-like peptidoglycan-associated protein
MSKFERTPPTAQCPAPRGAGPIGSVVALLLMAASPSPALAEGEGFSVDLFEPTPVQGRSVLGVGSSRTLEHGAFSIGFFASYQDDPLTLVDQSDRDKVLARFIDHRLTSDLQLAVGLFDLFELGLDLPLVLSQRGDDLAPLDRGGASVGGVALGDLTLIPRVQVVGAKQGLGLHLGARVTLPTGDAAQYASDGALRVRPFLVFGYHTDDFEVAADASFELRTPRRSGTYVSDDMVRWGLGARVPVVSSLKAIASVQGTIQTASAIDPFDETAPLEDAPSISLEAMAGLDLELVRGLTLTAGGGASVLRAVGSPDLRAFVALTFTTRGGPAGPDTDRDGVEDLEDRCPLEPEDEDDFQDDDGCPDPDDDNDGILDAADRCRRSPEDLDNYQDEDGCPDGRPIVSTRDDCPDAPEDEDGYKDEDGCPDPDNDNDGVFDVADACPMEREDKDGFKDEDGCPDPDNDNDGVLDAADKCPTQGEVLNQLDDGDGCPDTTIKDVKLTATAILIDKRVDFGLDSDRILPASMAMLDAVAAVLRENPWMTKVRVEVHTDSEGTEEGNLKLTLARANSVITYLASKGVESTRLEPSGRGESRPIATNNNPAGRAKNRRVEFYITENAGVPVPEVRP